MLALLLTAWEALSRDSYRAYAADRARSQQSFAASAARPELAVAALLQTTGCAAPTRAASLTVLQRAKPASASASASSSSKPRPRAAGLDTPCHALTAIMRGSASATYDTHCAEPLVEAEWEAYQRALRYHPDVYSRYFQHLEPEILQRGSIARDAFRHTTLRNMFTNPLWSKSQSQPLSGSVTPASREQRRAQAHAQTQAQAHAFGFGPEFGFGIEPGIGASSSAPPPASAARSHSHPQRASAPPSSAESGATAEAKAKAKAKADADADAAADRAYERNEERGVARVHGFDRAAVRVLSAFVLAAGAQLDVVRARAAAVDDALARINVPHICALMQLAATHARSLAVACATACTGIADEYAAYLRAAEAAAWDAAHAAAADALSGATPVDRWIAHLGARFDAITPRVQADIARVASGETPRELTLAQIAERRAQVLDAYRRDACRHVRAALGQVEAHVAGVESDAPTEPLRAQLAALRAYCAADAEAAEMQARDAEARLDAMRTFVVSRLGAEHADADVNVNNDGSAASARTTTWADAMRAAAHEDVRRMTYDVLNEVRAGVTASVADMERAPRRIMELCALGHRAAGERSLTAQVSRVMHLLLGDAQLVAHLNLADVAARLHSDDDGAFPHLFDEFDRGIESTILPLCKAARTTCVASARVAHRLCEAPARAASDIVLGDLSATWSLGWCVDVHAWRRFDADLRACVPHGAQTTDMRALLARRDANATPTMREAFAGVRALFVHIAGMQD